VSEDRGPGGFAQGASAVFAQRDDGRLRSALDEFENVLKIALDDLFNAISDILPDRYVALSDEDEDEDPPGREIVVAGLIVDDAQESLNEAFAELDWPLQRALRQLREALR
jgi:hypothetical protein